jgi:hypothetical protein
MKRLTVKPKAVAKKKKRIENAPHWTHAGTIAERRKALEDLNTNRQFANELQANRIREHVTNTCQDLRVFMFSICVVLLGYFGAKRKTNRC